LTLCKIIKRIRGVIIALETKLRARIELQADLEVESDTLKKIIDWLVVKKLTGGEASIRIQSRSKLVREGNTYNQANQGGTGVS